MFSFGVASPSLPICNVKMMCFSSGLLLTAGDVTDTRLTGTLLATRIFPPESVVMPASSGMGTSNRFVLDVSPNPEGCDALVGPNRWVSVIASLAVSLVRKSYVRGPDALD